jgi:acid phosphatase type 7
MFNCHTAAALAFLIVSSLHTTALALAITRGPYIQNVTPDSVTIVWRTDTASDGRVDYGLTSSYTHYRTNSTAVTQQALTIIGLMPATTYHYKVSSGAGTVSSADLTFRTGKGPGYDSFTFVAMGDHNSLPAAHTEVANRVAIIDPEIIIDVGDLVYNGDSTSGWDTEFFTPQRAVMSRSCLYPAIGNHEGSAGNYLNYFILPSANSGTERYYSFDYANAHFIALDTHGSSYAAGSAQYNWLVSDLTANQLKPWIFVYFHHPPYSSGSYGSDLNVRTHLAPVFAQYPVDLIFSGHDHNYEHARAGGRHYIVTGGGGAPLGAVGANSWTIKSESTLQCCRIDVSGDTLQFQAIRPDGTIIESFTLASAGINDWSLY